MGNHTAIIILIAKAMSQRAEDRKGRVRLPERARRDVAALRASFLQMAEEEINEIGNPAPTQTPANGPK
jgi:hypothetical protein